MTSSSFAAVVEQAKSRNFERSLHDQSSKSGVAYESLGRIHTIKDPWEQLMATNHQDSKFLPVLLPNQVILLITESMSKYAVALS